MQNNEKLIELIEQAASAVTMLSPDDRSDADHLLDIVTQISENISDVKNGPEELLQQTQNAVTEVSLLLSKVLDPQTDKCSELVDSISNSVIELQNMIKQIVEPQKNTEESVGSEEDSTLSEESSPAGMVISEEDAPLVLDFIAESSEHIEAAEGGLLDLESKPDDSEVLNLIFRSFHTIKGMAGFLNLIEIGALAHLTENLLDMARKGQLLLSGNNTDLVFESIDLMKKMIEELQGAIETNASVPAQDGLPAMLKKLESVTASESDDKPIAKSSEAPSKPEVLEPKHEIPTTETVKQETPKDISEDLLKNTENQAKTNHKVATSDEKIKVSTDRLDNLVNMAGELVIAQLMVAEEAAANEISRYELTRKISHQEKIIRELQELSMSMRMVQISGVFQKMTRLVRDVSKKAQKQINFITEGEETELDRSIVDKIADPLIHMLRNSVDHGVESPEVRTQKGKDPVGKVVLRAFHQAGNIVIQIEDDGKGLDRDRILKKAIDNGVVDAEQQLTDEQIYKLIFHAGLSTAEKITSVSGRGVGMDVVKKNIEALRGRIEITSTQGQGTIFTIRLPLTLAMIDGQVVKVGNERYIIPISSIIGTLRPETTQISTIQNKIEMVLVRGELIPLVRLYKQFEVMPQTEEPTDALLVIVEDDDQRKCCLLVDDLLAQQRVVIKSLGSSFSKVDCVSGGAIMGDGKVSLILDVPSLIGQSHS